MNVNEIQCKINALLDKSILTENEEDELDVLGDILISLEEDVEIPDMYGLEMLYFLMEDRNISVFSIEKVLGKPIPSDLKEEDIKVLSLYFQIPENVFRPRSNL